MVRSFFIILILISFVVSCNFRSNDVQTKNTVESDTVSQCYQFAQNRDSIFLAINFRGDSIVGTLAYRYFQKDKNVGTLRGKMVGDLLIADYVFTSEGIQSTRQVVFKKVEDDFIEGHGDHDNKNGRDFFKNIDALDFSDSIILRTGHCHF